MKEINKLSFGDRILMVWYWLASFGFFQSYRKGDEDAKVIPCYNILWRTIRECDFAYNGNFRERIGKIELDFDCEGDLEWINIDRKRIFVPRSIAVLCKKKFHKTREQRKKEISFDAGGAITESYMEAKGL